MFAKFLLIFKKIFLIPFFEMVDVIYPAWSDRRLRADLYTFGEVLKETINDPQLAREKIGKIRETHLRVQSLTFIACITRESSDIDLARKTANKIQDPWDQAGAYMLIVGITHQSRDFDMARRAVDKITDPYMRAIALKMFGQFLSKTKQIINIS